MLILSQFLEVAAPALPAYPREIWLAINVADVDGVVALAVGSGGSVVRHGEDQPARGVRAAIIADNEGHINEVVGPMSTATVPVADPLALAQS